MSYFVEFHFIGEANPTNYGVILIQLNLDNEIINQDKSLFLPLYDSAGSFKVSFYHDDSFETVNLVKLVSHAKQNNRA